jgi:hypothetical protein
MLTPIIAIVMFIFYVIKIIIKIRFSKAADNFMFISFSSGGSVRTTG